MNERIQRAGRTSWALLGVVALVAALGVLAWYLRVIWPPLVLAGAIVFVLHPLVTALQKRGLPRVAGAAVAYLAVLGAIAGAVLLVIPLATAQVDQLSAEWPEIRARGEHWIDARAADSQGTFFEFSRSDLENALSGNGASFQEQLQSVRDVGLQVFHVLLIFVLAPIIAFYLLVDTPHLGRVARSLVPASKRAEVEHVARRLNRAIGGFFRGQLLVALVVGVLSSIGLAAIGLEFWFLVGMIAGLFNLIPLIGPWIGGVPGVAIALTTGSLLQAIGVVVVMVVVQQIDNHIITPSVMQRVVNVHPATVMLALLAGGTLFGFMGLLLAVPGVASLKIVIGHLWRTYVLEEPWDGPAPEEVAADDSAVLGHGAGGPTADSPAADSPAIADGPAAQEAAVDDGPAHDVGSAPKDVRTGGAVP